MFNISNLFYSKRYRSLDIFKDVIGYEDIKNLLCIALASEHSISILLSGNPGNGKSTFLKCIEEQYNKCSVFFDCTLMSKAGLRDFLIENSKIKILLLDEISRLRKTDQEILLNLLHDGRIIDIHSGGQRKEIKFNSLKVFATCNDIEKIIPPLRDRFDEYLLPEYTYEQFKDICSQIIRNSDINLKIKMANSVWNQLGSNKIRDVVNMSKYVKSYSDISKYISIKEKYKIADNPRKLKM